MVDYLKLQNGSDIRGVAIDGVDGQSVNLTDDVVVSIGKAFALWLKNRLGRNENIKIYVGRDSRLSGKTLESKIIEGLIYMGIDVYSCGLSSTPAMFMSTVTEGHMADGAVMITASHLPFNRNGFKFFTRSGGREKAVIKEILLLAQKNDFIKCSGGKCSNVDFMSVYADGLVKKIREKTGEEKPLHGFKIVVDAGNGAGGFFVKDVLVPLGADTRGSQFLEPDGSFPNHIPNPEDKVAMSYITKAVIENNADLGIIFDTDVDRAAAVSSDGKEINRNRLIALIGAILLRENKGAVIVTDSVTSTGLSQFIKEQGGVHHRFKRGYRNVINEAIRLNNEGKNAPLAMETSGHGALKENYFLDDGAYLCVVLLAELANARKKGQKLDSLISTLKEPCEKGEYRMNILCENFAEYGNQVIKELEEYANTVPYWKIADDNYEGIRVYADKNHGDGWFLLRMSLHDPLMPLNIESDSVGGECLIKCDVYSFLKKFDKLDTEILAK